MSSTFLYLAIVVVWAAFLVPMWLRRDNEGLSRILHRNPDPAAEDDEFFDALDDEDPLLPAEDEEALEPELEQAPRRITRATIIARRRRRTSGLIGLLLISVLAAVAGLAPPWIAGPPVLFLAGHLWLLRVAVGMDAVRAREAARARHEARLAHEAQLAREAEAALADAEIIDITGHTMAQEVFDQYAKDTPRAVGD